MTNLDNHTLETVIEVVSLYAGTDVELMPDTAITADGVIDSLNILQIVVELERRFGIKIGAADISFDDFRTPRQLSKAVSLLLKS